MTALIHFVMAAALVWCFYLPDPPNGGFGEDLFGVVIMSWATANALFLTMAFLNFAVGLVQLFDH